MPNRIDRFAEQFLDLDDDEELVRLNFDANEDSNEDVGSVEDDMMVLINETNPPSIDPILHRSGIVVVTFVLVYLVAGALVLWWKWGRRKRMKRKMDETSTWSQNSLAPIVEKCTEEKRTEISLTSETRTTTAVWTQEEHVSNTTYVQNVGQNHLLAKTETARGESLLNHALLLGTENRSFAPSTSLEQQAEAAADSILKAKHAFAKKGLDPKLGQDWALQKSTSDLSEQSRRGEMAFMAQLHIAMHQQGQAAYERRHEELRASLRTNVGWFPQIRQGRDETVISLWKSLFSSVSLVLLGEIVMTLWSKDLIKWDTILEHCPCDQQDAAASSLCHSVSFFKASMSSDLGLCSLLCRVVCLSKTFVAGPILFCVIHFGLRWVYAPMLGHSIASCWMIWNFAKYTKMDSRLVDWVVQVLLCRRLGPILVGFLGLRIWLWIVFRRMITMLRRNHGNSDQQQSSPSVEHLVLDCMLQLDKVKSVLVALPFGVGAVAAFACYQTLSVDDDPWKTRQE